MPVLSLLRVAADCDKVPPEVLILVKDLAQHARRHIRKVCRTLWSVYIYSFIFVHSVATSF
jgi:AP-4 complex subunit epsilon-1